MDKKDYKKYLNSIKDMDSIINKIDHLKKKKEPKQPKPVEILAVVQITLMVETTVPETVDSELALLQKAVDELVINIEIAPFRIGQFAGFGARLLCSPEQLPGILIAIGGVYDLNKDAQIKELDIATGKAEKYEVTNDN
jgi:hypothetical protein